VRLWRNIQDQIDQGRYPFGNLFEMSSFLYGKTEVGGHGWTSGALLSQVWNPQRCFSQLEDCTKTDHLVENGSVTISMISQFPEQIGRWLVRFMVLLLKAGDEVLIGGQAVFEGVMMRSPRSYSIAVRKPDQSIVTKKDYLSKVGEHQRIFRLPVIRGVVTLGQAFTLGVRALKFSTDQALLSRLAQSGKKTQERAEISPWMMTVNIAIAIFFFVLLFKWLPLVLTSQLKQHFDFLSNRFLFSLVDGTIRLAIFLTYILSISRLKDIRRLFEYHGAEHKVVFTFEAREHLSVENARRHSTLHPRCGTSFLMVVMLTSTFVYAFIPFDSFSLKLLSRVVLIPLIAGLSYEIIRFAAKHQNVLLNLITLPGLWLQRVTTKEPSDDQLEIAIRALDEAIFLENSEGQLAVI
jgi:uncharacterized protein YqhQ